MELRDEDGGNYLCDNRTGGIANSVIVSIPGFGERSNYIEITSLLLCFKFL